MLETKTVGSMTERQRRALAAQLHGETVEPFARVPAVMHFVGT